MRPTVRKWLGHEKQHGVNSVGKRIAKRCERAIAQRPERSRFLTRQLCKLVAGGSRERPSKRQFYRRRPKRSAGLTLIELLVVLTIIAAISALITTSVLSALKQQNQRICLNNMLTIEAAKDEYIRDHPGATSIPDSPSFQQYFKFGIPLCPDGGKYENLLSLTQPVNCSIHGSVSVSPTPTP